MPSLRVVDTVLSASRLFGLANGHWSIAGHQPEEKYMSSMWDYPNWLSSRNLVGHHVEAIDGHLGRVDQASNVVGRAHLVVDTGSSTLGTKRLIPSGFIQRIDDEHATIHVGLTKEQVNAAPGLDAKRRNERDEYDAYFETVRPSGVDDHSMVSVAGRNDAPAHD